MRRLWLQHLARPIFKHEQFCGVAVAVAEDEPSVLPGGGFYAVALDVEEVKVALKVVDAVAGRYTGYALRVIADALTFARHDGLAFTVDVAVQIRPVADVCPPLTEVAGFTVAAGDCFLTEGVGEPPPPSRRALARPS